MSDKLPKGKWSLDDIKKIRIPREIVIYRERVPDDQDHTLSITIRSKDHEVLTLEHALVRVLEDAVDVHQDFKSVRIIDARGEYQRGHR